MSFSNVDGRTALAALKEQMSKRGIVMLMEPQAYYNGPKTDGDIAAALCALQDQGLILPVASVSGKAAEKRGDAANARDRQVGRHSPCTRQLRHPTAPFSPAGSLLPAVHAR